MITVKSIRNRIDAQHSNGLILAIVAVAITLLSYFPANLSANHHDYSSFLFQTSRLPEPEATPNPEKPASWMAADKGGRREFDTITVVLPSGFTNQGGANVFANRLIAPSSLRKPSTMLPGTEFTVGIWPPNDQVQFQQPIEIRIMMNAGQVSTDVQNSLTLLMYNPATDVWEVQPSKFVESTFEVVASMQIFKPVAKDFPNWGGRTFFCVGNLERKPLTVRVAIAAVNRNANLRAGPGVTYAVVGQAAKGQPIQLTAKSADGRWYQVDSGAWIAAFLVDNAPALPVVSATPTPLPTALTPTPTLALNP